MIIILSRIGEIVFPFSVSVLFWPQGFANVYLTIVVIVRAIDFIKRAGKNIRGKNKEGNVSPFLPKSPLLHFPKKVINYFRFSLLHLPSSLICVLIFFCLQPSPRMLWRCRETYNAGVETARYGISFCYWLIPLIF